MTGARRTWICDPIANAEARVRAAEEKVPCKSCRAEVGQRCQRKGGGAATYSHVARWRAATAAGYLPLV